MNAPIPSSTAVPSWSWHMQALLRLRGLLESGVRENQEALQGDFVAASGAAERNQRSELLALLETEKAELAEIDTAIERIRTGGYGICEASGEEIPAEQLLAVPWARCRLIFESKSHTKDGVKNDRGGLGPQGVRLSSQLVRGT